MVVNTSRIVSPLILVIILVTLLITPFITTHEPPNVLNHNDKAGLDAAGPGTGVRRAETLPAQPLAHVVRASTVEALINRRCHDTITGPGSAML